MKQMGNNKTWHDKHRENLTVGQRVADKLALGMGSWPFIITQSAFIVVWIALNFIAYIYRWDPYPFILLNLLFSVQAAYAAPIIMMSQNRQTERDRYQATEDYKTNIKAKKEIEELQIVLTRIENEKIDEILSTLRKLLKTGQAKNN
jgi:Predicted membrane protein